MPDNQPVTADTARVVDPIRQQTPAATSSSSSSAVPVTGLLGGGLVAAGLVLELRRRRRSRQRRRTDNQELPAITPDLEPTEFAALVGADVAGAAFMEVALRAMAAGVADLDDPEAPLGVLLGADRLEVIPSEPGAAPAPFTNDAGRWRLDRQTEMASLAKAAGSRPMPVPTLVGFGRTADDTEVYVNLEDFGLITVGGPGACELVAAAGVQLATSTWQEKVAVILVGFDSPPSGRYVKAVDNLDKVMDRLDTAAADTAQMVRSSGCGSTFATRAREVYPDSWLPTVVVCLSPPPGDMARRLVAMCSSGDRAGVAAIVAGHVPEAPWEVEIVGGGIDLPDLGVVVTAPAGLSPSEVAGAAALLDLADADLVEVAPEPDPVLDDVEDPAFEVLVRVVGTPLIEGCGHVQRTKGREALVYMATHPDVPIDGDRLIERIWPGADPSASRRSFNTTMGELRRDLGTGADGEPYFPPLTGTQRLYALSGAVGTDVAVVAAALARDKAQPDEDSLAGLRSALELVRGVPFDFVGRGYEWAQSEGLVRQIEILVTDAAHRTSTRCREAGDHDGAAWAANQGLLVEPDQERLFRDIMLARDAMGNGPGVERTYEDLLGVLGDDEPAPETVAVFTRLVRSA